MPQSLPKAGSFNVPQALAQALKLHEQGRLAEAERLYAAVLAVRPDHFDALQMMGLVKLAAGQPAEALRLVAAAMGARKPSPQVLLNHGLILEALKRYPEAIESFDQAIKLKSKFAEAHNNRGATLTSLGRDEEALESCRKAIAIKPDYVEAHYNAGTALRALGRYDEALKSFDRALALQHAALQAFGIAERGDHDVDAGALRAERWQIGGHHHGGDVAGAQGLAADVDAEPFQHRGERLLGEGNIVEGVAGAVEADHQAVADELVLPHALDISEVLDARSRSRIRRGERGQ
jgi:tetratricopeptide (TPR) repeat protein